MLIKLRFGWFNHFYQTNFILRTRSRWSKLYSTKIAEYPFDDPTEDPT
jgi:hypothetical protein